MLVSGCRTLKSSGGDHFMSATATRRSLTLWSVVPSLMADARPRVKRVGETRKEIDCRILVLMKMRISMMKTMYRWRNCFGDDKVKETESENINRYI